jgi:indole-3-glycerol phosphate synthase
MSDILARIGATKRAEIELAKAARPLESVEETAREAPPPRGFITALRRRIEQGEHALIAEIKKASPSKGLIRPDFDPESLAAAYQRGGAACLSVLTDRVYFQGGVEDLRAARAAVDLPVLRKDFLFDTYQVVEARAMGADCILIIMAAVDDALAHRLEDTARSWDMDVLIEVHDEDELSRALTLASPLIGINNRDLRTFETRLETTERLAPLVSDGRLLVAESGLFARSDLDRLSRAGARAFLVGESLMREEDVEDATRRLLAPDFAAAHAP